MDKVNEKAWLLYPDKKVVLARGYTCLSCGKVKREAYLEGYYQSQKDLALTWEDMRELHIIFTEVDVEIELGKIDIKTETLGYYQEVLKRFKNLKK